MTLKSAASCKIVKGKKMKGKGHPRTGLESPEGEYRYSSTLSLSWRLVVGGWSTPCPDCFTSLERDPSTHCTGGWVGLRPSLDGCRKSPPAGIRSVAHPAHSE